MKKNTMGICIGVVAAILCGVIALTGINANKATPSHSAPVEVAPAQPIEAIAEGEPEGAEAVEAVETVWTSSVQFGELTLKSIKTIAEAEEMSYEEIYDYLVATNAEAVGFVREDDERLTKVTAEEAYVAEFAENEELAYLRANAQVVGLFESDAPIQGTATLNSKGMAKGTYSAEVMDWFQKGASGWALTEERASRCLYNVEVIGKLNADEAFDENGARRYGGSVRLLAIDNDHYVWVVVVAKASAPVPATAPAHSEPTTEPTVEPTSEPTTEPTSEPTTEPTTEPTSEPTTEPTPAHEPEATLPPQGTTHPRVTPTPAPAHEPEATLPPKGTTHPRVTPSPAPTAAPATGRPAHAAEITIPAATATARPEPTLPPKGGSSSDAPAMGGITW